jgi:hypothetical protein
VSNNLVSVGLYPSGQAIFERSLQKAYGKIKNLETMVKRSVRAALNEVGKKGRSTIANRITESIAIKRKDVLQYVTVSKPLLGSGSVMIVLSKTKRIQLGYFSPRATGRAAGIELDNRKRKAFGPHIRHIEESRGVSYRIERRGRRKNIKGAYITPVKRAAQSKASYDVKFTTQKLVQRRYGKKQVLLRGPSPWGVYIKTKAVQKDIRKEIKATLKKAMNEQIRVAKLRASGVIATGKGNQDN